MIGDVCPDAAKHHHPDIPDGYIDRQDWMRMMARTHVQRRCPTCRRFFVWTRKTVCRCGKLIVNVELHERRHHHGARR